MGSQHLGKNAFKSISIHVNGLIETKEVLEVTILTCQHCYNKHLKKKQNAIILLHHKYIFERTLII